MYPRFRRARAHKTLTRATGTSIVLNSTSIAELAAATNGPGTAGFDLALPAAVGDTLEWGFDGFYGAEAVYGSIEIYTMVSSSRVNPFGGGLSTSLASTHGPAAFLLQTGVEGPLVGSALYVVQSNDIASGTVTCRPHYATSLASNKTLYSGGSGWNFPLQMWLKNLGPVAV